MNSGYQIKEGGLFYSKVPCTLKSDQEFSNCGQSKSKTFQSCRDALFLRQITALSVIGTFKNNLRNVGISGKVEILVIVGNKGIAKVNVAIRDIAKIACC